MKVITAGRKIDMTEAIRKETEKRLLKLSKFFADEVEAHVTYTAQKAQASVEVTIFQGGMIYRGEETASDKYAALDRAVDIIERQIRKNKTRLEKKIKMSAFDSLPPMENDAEETEFEIVKTKKYHIKPMSPEEAILQMNLIGHTFFLFKNAETEENNIVYKRKDGKYGLIETE